MVFHCLHQCSHQARKVRIRVFSLALTWNRTFVRSTAWSRHQDVLALLFPQPPSRIPDVRTASCTFSTTSTKYRSAPLSRTMAHSTAPVSRSDKMKNVARSPASAAEEQAIHGYQWNSPGLVLTAHVFLFLASADHEDLPPRAVRHVRESVLCAFMHWRHRADASSFGFRSLMRKTSTSTCGYASIRERSKLPLGAASLADSVSSSRFPYNV